MRRTPTAVAILLLGAVLLASSGRTEHAQQPNSADDEGVVLFSHHGRYKMSPAPTLYSDLIRVQLQSVELLAGPTGAPLTKITYRPWYGKISAQFEAFRKTHETQTVSFLLFGDHTAKVKKGDILRMCFYPN